jgi:tRNA threonylcarbamoyladenosine biosynthesis protein TsaB
VPIFCLDTSTRAGSMALWRDGSAISVIHSDSRSHAERLPTEALAWLSGKGVGFDGLDAIAVVAGPGSFTGLRVGVAAAQGWAFAAGKPVIAVPTLDALASDRAVSGLRDALVIPMIDGQRSEIFYSAWRNGAEVLPAAAARPADAVDAIRTAFPGAAVVAIGDGVAKYRSVVDAAGWSSKEMAAPLAESAVRLAAEDRYPRTLPHAIRPIYVRRPDAEVAREKRAAE